MQRESSPFPQFSLRQFVATSSWTSTYQCDSGITINCAFIFNDICDNALTSRLLGVITYLLSFESLVMTSTNISETFQEIILPVVVTFIVYDVSVPENPIKMPRALVEHHRFHQLLFYGSHGSGFNMVVV